MCLLSTRVPLLNFYPLLLILIVLISTAKRMEDLLQNIIKDAAGKQNQNLKQAAQIAYGKRANIVHVVKLMNYS